MSLNFIWCISYNWPDAVWAQFPNSLGCLTGSSVWLLLSPLPCCSWLLFQLYAWPYVFFLLPNYSEIFPGENWTSIFLFDWIFLIEDLRITLNRKKNPFTQGAVRNGLQGAKTRLGCFSGQTSSELPLSFVSSSCPVFLISPCSAL